MRLIVDECIKDDLWELRHPDGRGVVSSIPYCGYSKDTLASLRRSGFQIYHNEKLIRGRKRNPLAASSGAAGG